VPAPISLRRLAATAAVLFVLILAFLAGRVNAGADPAQMAAPASSKVAPAPEETDPYGDDRDDDDFPELPGQGAAPDQGSAPSPGGQDFDPPVTEAS
jgi:hypothetical protein